MCPCPDWGACGLHAARVTFGRGRVGTRCCPATILVATDRAPGVPRLEYTARRSTAVSYARITASIPPAHELGKIEGPSTHGAVRPDRARNFMVQSAVALPSAAAFQTAVHGQSGEGRGGDIVGFVHGHNNTYAGSVYRLAQFAYVYEFPVSRCCSRGGRRPARLASFMTETA